MSEIKEFEFFVNPKHVTTLYPWKHIPGAQEHFIVVKKFLSTREAQEVQTSGIDHVRASSTKGDDKDALDGSPKDSKEVRMALSARMKTSRAAKYIVSWSLTRGGEAVPVNEQTIGELHETLFEAIDKALDAHKEQVEKEKNDQSGGSTSTSA